jgi:hypothetical protein
MVDDFCIAITIADFMVVDDEIVNSSYTVLWRENTGSMERKKVSAPQNSIIVTLKTRGLESVYMTSKKASCKSQTIGIKKVNCS